MRTEQQQLSLKDLSARQPYGVMVQVNGVFHDSQDERLGYVDCFNNQVHIHGYNFGIDIDNIKPYLRPMDTMTEKEAVEYFRLQTYNEYADVTGFKIDKATLCLKAYVDNVYKWYCWGDVSNIKTLDWLLENHFDFRGLIWEELGLPAKEGMYNF